ncbi:MAG: uracil-DNA glycosylase [Verrucomicrobiales bacterium]|jgi:uracil-DNA glycosylase
MHRPPVACGPVLSRVLLVGQAPGVKEPVLQRPFAWTAGKTLFKWFESAAAEVTEARFRDRIYFAATCRCFPGKAAKGGGDRVPDTAEIANCVGWLEREFEILEPDLVLAVGKLAISQFLKFSKLTEVIGQSFQASRFGRTFDLIPLPHPSGASTWPRMEPGKSLTESALRLAVSHPAFVAEAVTEKQSGR